MNDVFWNIKLNALYNNGVNIAGVAPNARIIPVSINLENNGGSIDFTRAINWAWKNGADILSCSWAYPYSDCIKDAINNALTKGRNGKGCVFVNSAGNVNEKGDYSPTFPAYAVADIIAVSAIEQSGEWHNQSCYGDCVSVCAPGKDIWTT